MKHLLTLLAVCCCLLPYAASCADPATNVIQTMVTVAVEDAEAAEPPSGVSAVNTGRFVVRRTAVFTNLDLLVNYTLAGTASNGVDYARLSGTVVIPAGKLGASVYVTPLPDGVIEERETVTLQVESPICPAIYPPPPGCYLVGTPSAATVAISDANTNLSPAVRIISPANGAVIAGPTNVPVAAEAWDTNGTIRKVEFIGDNLIIKTMTNAPYQAVWTNVTVGHHVLRARATDNQGATTLSTAVEFTVTTSNSAPVQPAVTITAIDPVATEIPTVPPGMGMPQRVDFAVFSVARTGSTAFPLEVYYSIAGRASNGVDYVRLPGRVTIPLGERTADIVVQPIYDEEAEREDTVVLTLEAPACIAIYPPPPECYLVGSPSSATVVILDGESTTTNRPPTVNITSPARGAVFTAPAIIPVAAQALDTDGNVLTVEFFNGTNSLGTRTNNPLVASAQNPFTLVWSNVPVGEFTLRARATDNDGASAWSEPVSVAVRTQEVPAFVKRQLPPFYVPGVKLGVRLLANPPAATLSYSVEDTPPANWAISAVGEGGQVDAAASKVRFGPFTNSTLRTLYYEVTPPASASTIGEFLGSATADDVLSRVGGARLIRAALPHPADRSPTNMVIDAAEVTAYMEAWKTCPLQAPSPAPVPVNYLTRAGFLARSGGAYAFSTSLPTPYPPLLWVPASNTTPPVAAAPEREANTITGWSADTMASVMRTMPTNYQPGVSFEVTLRVVPPANALAWAVEERIPEGWQVSSISDEGMLCRVTGKLKFGLFRDTLTHDLRYTLTPPTNAAFVGYFAGVASFDGVNRPVTGRSRITRELSIEPPTPPIIRPDGTGLNLLRFPGEAGVNYRVEASVDLIEWVPIESLLNSDGTLDFLDPEAASLNRRFYRIVTD